MYLQKAEDHNRQAQCKRTTGKSSQTSRRREETKNRTKTQEEIANTWPERIT